MAFVIAPKGIFVDPSEEIEWEIDDDEWFLKAVGLPPVEPEEDEDDDS